MKTIAEALAEVMALATPGRSISADFAGVHGAFLSEPVDAVVAVPPFAASTVDGYAVRAIDVAPDARLLVAAESRAGGPTPIGIAAGTTVRIFTGAPLPDGADAVVMQEIVRREGEVAIFERATSAGANVRAPGSDVAVGERLLDAGAHVDAGAIALLASQGLAHASVHTAPRVGIVTTGDEVVTLEAQRLHLGYGSIHDANGPMLAALCAEAGARASGCTHARDELEATRDAIESACLTSDVVVIAGGVSVGDHDVVHAALAALGVEQRLWKVRMKPGKPFTLGVRGAVPILGVPGNPVSAWVGFELFVRPTLRRMLGDPRPYRRVVEVTLAAPVRPSVDRTELARARIDDDGRAWPMPKQRSSAITSTVHVDALLILPESDRELAVGDRVRAMLLDGRGSSASPFAR